MKTIFILIIVVVTFAVHPAGSAELTILTENLPPLNYVKDGVLMGSSVEIVQEIQRRIGSKEPIQVFPWARAYRLVLEE